MSLKIVIDARMIKPGSMHGIARYVHNLLHHLKSQGLMHKFYVLINPNSPLEKIAWPAHIELVTIKAAWISLWEHWELPKVLRRLNADLFHAPSYVAPIF